MTYTTTATPVLTKVRISRFIMNEKNLIGRVLVGTVIRETEKAILFNGYCTAEASDNCHRCQRVITHPKSLRVGYGPDCSKRLGVDWNASMTDEELEAIRHEIEATNPYNGWLPKSSTVILKVAKAHADDQAAHDAEAQRKAEQANPSLELRTYDNEAEREAMLERDAEAEYYRERNAEEDARTEQDRQLQAMIERKGGTTAKTLDWIQRKLGTHWGDMATGDRWATLAKLEAFPAAKTLVAA